MKNQTITSPPLPPTLDEQQAQKLLKYLAAWKLTEVANLEIGSRVLVIGSGWPARSVLRLCALRGCLQRTICGPEELADEAEWQMDSLKPLPQSPDAIFILENAAQHLPQVLPLCAAKGTVVMCDKNAAPVDLDFYADAHKRGLRVMAVNIAEVENWKENGDLLSRLVLRGALKD